MVKLKNQSSALQLVKAKGSVRAANAKDEAFEVLCEAVDDNVSKSLAPEHPDVIVTIANLIENISPKLLKHLKGSDKKQLLIRLLEHRFGTLDGQALGRLAQLIDFVCESGLVNKVSNAVIAKKGLLSYITKCFV